MQTSKENDFFNNKVTFVNFILAVAVMFIHSENIALYNNTLSFIPNVEYFISYSLGNLAVPTFFMMSSYLFYRNFHPDQLTGKLKRRAKSVLFPYLIWNLLYFLLFYIVTFFPGIRSFMVTEHFILSPQTILDAILFHKYNRIFWFMQQLIYFICFSPLIYCLLKKKYGIIFTIIFLSTSLYYPMFPDHPYGIRIDMMVYWILGCYFARHKPIFFEKRRTKNLTFSSAFMCLLLLITRFLLEYVIDLPSISRIFSPLLLLFNVLFLWPALDPVIPSGTKWWMRISFFVYVMHPLLIDAFSKIYAHLLPDNTFFCLSNYLFAVIFSFLFISISAKFLLKYFPKLWYILNGGRTP